MPFTGDEYEHESDQLIGEFKIEKRKWNAISLQGKDFIRLGMPRKGETISID